MAGLGDLEIPFPPLHGNHSLKPIESTPNHFPKASPSLYPRCWHYYTRRAGSVICGSSAKCRVPAGGGESISFPMGLHPSALVEGQPPKEEEKLHACTGGRPGSTAKSPLNVPWPASPGEVLATASPSPKMPRGRNPTLALRELALASERGGGQCGTCCSSLPTMWRVKWLGSGRWGLGAGRGAGRAVGELRGARAGTRPPTGGGGRQACRGGQSPSPHCEVCCPALFTKHKFKEKRIKRLKTVPSEH